MVTVTDKGSKTHKAHVVVQGVPAQGVIDTGAEITIMGGDLFRQVAAASKLKKSQFKAPDKTPRTYNQQTFHLDGRIAMDISFGDRTMNTTVYVKMDAPEQLLLGEGVCRQLGIVSYHKDVTPSTESGAQVPQSSASVPIVRVQLMSSLTIPPWTSVQVPVKLTEDWMSEETLMLEPDPDTVQDGVQALPVLLQG